MVQGIPLRILGGAERRHSNRCSVGDSVSRKITTVDVDDLLVSLLDAPPQSQQEMTARIGEAGSALVSCMMQRIARDDLDRLNHRTGIPQLLSVLGPSSLERKRLALLVLDTGLSRRSRSVAMACLSTVDPGQMERVSAKMDSGDMVELTRISLLDPLQVIQACSNYAKTATHVLVHATKVSPGHELAGLDELLVASGTSPILAYQDALFCPDLKTLRPQMLQSMVDTCGAAAWSALEELQDVPSVPDPDFKRDVADALRHLKAKELAGKLRWPTVHGKAWIGTCDGQGAFVMFCVLNPKDGAHTLANLCIRASADIRDGFAKVDVTDEELRVMTERMEKDAAQFYAEAPLSVAAQLMQEGLERTRAMGKSLPEDALPSIRLLQHVQPGGFPDLMPIFPSGPDQARAQLDAHPCLDSWFFDASDLRSVGVQPPCPGDNTTAWKTAAVRALDTEQIRERVASMSAHMSLCHALRGEAHLLGVFSGLTAEVSARFAGSTLVEFMLDQTLEKFGALGVEKNTKDRCPGSDPTERADGEPHSAWHDPAVRRVLKARFFANVKDPRGKDLATLDLAEMIYQVLEQRAGSWPGGHNLRTEDMEAAAYNLAKELVAMVLKGPAKVDPVKTLPGLADVLSAHLGGSREQAAKAAVDVLLSWVRFAHAVCSPCPVGCLDRLKVKMAEEFFAVEHPALK